MIPGFSSPEGIAVDYLGRTLYVTDTGLDVVAVVSMNGTYKKTLFSGDLRDPRGIVVDPIRGQVLVAGSYLRNCSQGN